MSKFKSNGKLLLTGEYVVLDGALALAVPTKYGQTLTINEVNEPKIYWTSFDETNTIWFENTFELINGAVKPTRKDDISDRLVEIFEAITQLNPSFLNTQTGLRIETHLEFPKNWGLGTSSTLINNLAQWANINPYKLLDLTFGGSGYDIACAQNNTPVTYKLENLAPEVKAIDFNPSFKRHLFFVYLNAKQNSREGIAHYKRQDKANLQNDISHINDITRKMINCVSLKEFCMLLETHERIITNITNQKPVKDLFFKDFKGSIKSLGAWGGDFILVASKEDPSSYFKQKGFDTIVPYSKMILES